VPDNKEVESKEAAEPLSGRRDDSDLKMRDSYLETGKIPAGLAFRKGLTSILCDPWKCLFQYMPGPLGFKLRQLYYRRKLGSMGKGALIDPNVEILGPKNVYLDDFAYLGRNAQLVAPEGYIRIGKRCHLTSRILGHGGVEIGDCVAGAGIILSATDSHQGGFRMSGPMVPPDQRNIKKDKVIIEKDAFIGQYSIIMPGVKIGEGAVVGPHSLIVRDVKPWTVVMGNPPKVIEKRDKVKFD